ncbi:MAG: FAD-dependent oxidoreductase [Caldisphaera sp.]|jgi:thioredoxin reductase (NADPH)|nr:FAD-dependent oxidoreductase [Caldisphaera sp.]PMP88044.1 MAG: thioredoxin reductase [Caldisphaera sp.]
MSLRLGTKITRPPKGERYDTLIVGGGPAGFSAAIYASRFLLKSAIVAEEIGGQLNLTDVVDDYPATLSIKASELVSRFREHAEKLFRVPVYEFISVKKFDKVQEEYHVVGSNGLDVYAKTIILAVGSKRRKLNVPGENEFAGKGVSYCSICDAPLYKGRDSVVVVGGGDAALEGALLLSGYVKKVYLVHRRDQFRAKPFYVTQVLNKKNIDILYNSLVIEIKGDTLVKGAIVQNKKTQEKKELLIDGIFIEIGFEPPKEWYQSLGLETDELGYIKVDDWMKTNLPGVFAAGDATSKWRGFRQIVNAAASGAIAAYSAYTYLTEKLSSVVK